MYQKLVTQLSNTFSQVLLLAPEGNLSQLLKNQLQKSGFNVVRLDPLKILTSNKTRQQLEQENFYKIILLHGWSQNVADYRQLTTWLQTRHEPMLIISRLDSVPKTKIKNFTGLKKRQQQEKAIAYFVESLPKSSLLVGRDVVDKSSLNLGLAYICRELPNRRLFDPVLDFYFISSNQFLVQNSNVLLAPYTGEKYLFQASAIEHERLISQLLRYSDLGTQVTTEPEEGLPFTPPFKLKTLLGVSDLDFLSTNFVQQLAIFVTIQPPIQAAQTVKTDQIKPKQKNKPPPEDNGLPIPPPRFSLPTKKAPTRTDEILLHQFEQQVMAQDSFYRSPHFSPDRSLHISQKYLEVSGCNLINQVIFPRAPAATEKTEPLKVPPILEVGYFERSLFMQTKQKTLQTELEIATNQVIARNQAQIAQVKERPLKTKKKSRKNKVLVKKRSDARQLRKKILARSAIAVLSLGLLGWLIVPRYQNYQRQTALQEYFNNCYQQQSCLTQESAERIADLADEGMRSSDSVATFALQIKELSAQQKLFNQQLARLYKTIIQAEVGDVNQELELVNNQATASLDKIETTETSFQAAAADLKAILPDLDLDIFTNELSNLKTEILLWQKYQDLFAVLAEQENVNGTLALLDNINLLSQGGQLLAFNNFKLQFGQLSDGSFTTAQDLAKNSKIKVEPNEIFKTDKNSSQISGIYHLAFQSNFSTFSEKVEKLLELGKDVPSDLVIGINLNTYSQLAGLAQGKEPQIIFDEVKQSLADLKGEKREAYLTDLYQKLWLSLSKENDQQEIAKLVFALLKQINQQEIAFGSKQPGLAELINTLGLNNDHLVASCPTSLNAQAECYLDSFSQTRSVLTGKELLTQENTHFIELQAQTAAHTRTLTYKNSGNQSYSEFLIFNLPEGATSVNLTINGAVQEVDENGGFIIKVPAQSTVMATLTFKVERTLNKSNFIYSFSEQKQAGSWGEKLQVIFKNSLPYSPKVIAPSATIESKRIGFNRVQDQSFLGAVAF